MWTRARRGFACVRGCRRASNRCSIRRSRPGSPAASRRRRRRRREAWPAIKAGRHTLIAAPTGSGKTLAAFLAAIDELVRQRPRRRARRRDAGRLRLAAQGAVERHPAQPRGAARRHPRASCGGAACPTSRSAPGCAPATRPPAERDRMRRRPPHILVTTPESLYILLGSESGRKMLATDAHGDRRRNPRHGAEQARRASRAVARTARGAVRRPAAAHRPVGDAEADRRRSRISWSAPRRTDARPRRSRSSTPAISARATSRSNCPVRRWRR